MIALEIPTISNQLVDTTLDGRDSILYRDIQGAPLPLFVKLWFHIGVEAWFASEYAHRMKQGNFNYQDDTVQALLSPFDRALKETARFSRSECAQVIEGALRHELAYLKHPVDAVTGILFQRSEVIDGGHVVDFLNQFQREPFYAASIQKYVEQHDDARLDRDLLEQFLSNAEREAYETRPIETFGDAVRAITEILGIVGSNGTPDQISMEVWTELYQERQLSEALPQFPEVVGAYQAQQRQSLNIEDLVVALTEGPPTSIEASEDTPAFGTEFPEPEAGQTPEAAYEEFETHDADIPSLHEEPAVASTFAPPEEEPEILIDHDVTAEDSETPAEGSDQSESSVTEDSSEPPKPSRPMMDESMAITQSIIPPRAVDIPPVEISDKLERMFIKKLFIKDANAYHETLEKLDKALSWEEAFSIIEEIWQDRGLNLFSKESQEFTRVFYERYYPPT